MPNHSVDVNSWGDKPVIPGSFYPLSDGIPLIPHHRITKSHFRTCSTVGVAVKLPSALCTLRMVSNHSEETLERLRCLPEATAPVKLPLTLSLQPGHDGRWLETQYCEAVVCIPTMAPRQLALPILSLHHLSCTCNTESQYQAGVKSMITFRLAQVTSIFTGTSNFTGCIV